MMNLSPWALGTTMQHFKLLPTAFALLALATCTSAWADKSWYFLGALGPSSYGGGTQTDADADLARQGKTGISSSSASSSTGYKAMLGYQLSPRFAVEGGYVDMGSLGYNASFTGGSIAIDSRATGLNFSGLGLMPVNYQLSVFGKLGYTLGSVTARGSSGGTTVGLTQDKSSLGLGFGGIYNITHTIGLRAEWEKLYSDVNLLSFGLQARF
jgi:OmpA-OmpF porin, OOP family